MQYGTAAHELIRFPFGSAQAPQMDYAAALAHRAEHLFEVLRVAWIDAEPSARFAVSVRRFHHDARRAEPGRQSIGKTCSVIEDYVRAGSRTFGRGGRIGLFPNQFVDPVGGAGD